MSRNGSIGNLKAVLLIVFIATLAPGAWAQHNYKSLYAFTGGADGSSPWAGLILDQAGNLYGTTPTGGSSDFPGGTVFKLTPNSDGSWTESVLYNFCSLTNCTDGAQPFGGLTFDQSGNLYGTAGSGGSGAFCSRQGGCGVVFKLTPHSDGSWTESVLSSFCSRTNCTDGVFPIGTLIFDQAGNLYDMTVGGGIVAGPCGSGGCGVVFELMPHSDGSWTESVLHSFCSFTNCSDGFEPQSGVTFDAKGNLYGTAGAGGRSLSCNVPYGCGVVFKLTPSANGHWTDQVLHRFAGKDGDFPTGHVVFDPAGNLYSTTELGGDLSKCNGFGGCGAVFQLTLSAHGSWKEQVLYRFTGAKDGRQPHAGLIFDPAGNLYGTAGIGGKLSCGLGAGCGVVFKLAPNSKGGWKETVLQYFANHPGAQPLGDLIFDAAGNLYGTTNGISPTNGSVFEITP
jgi:uncharacterized repeat protein (TIGR03803 family)